MRGKRDRRRIGQLRTRGATMKEMAEEFIRIVDAINERVKILGLTFGVMTFTMCYEIVARFGFNAPTKWAWEVNGQLLCFAVTMAGGYTLLQKGHVKTDILYSRWSPKMQAKVDLFFTTFLALLFCGNYFVWSIKMAIDSVVTREHSIGLLRAPLYPIKIAIVVATFLFLIQIVAEAIRNYFIVINKQNNSSSQ
jgi:TRAP-type mannitol/chloroaromatic compound transport system permease small subunit